MKKFVLKSGPWFVFLIALIFLTGCPSSSRTKKLTKEDKARVDVLQDEVIGRIDEIGMITGRLLGKKLSPIGKFEMSISENRTETKGKVTPLDDELVVGYYCDPPGICTPEPCETATAKIPFSGGDSLRMKILQRELVNRIDEIGKIVGNRLEKKLSPVGKCWITLKGTGTSRSVHVEMEPVIVSGDGNGCYLDPPGICCECPCPE
jgi:hypothetical protein